MPEPLMVRSLVVTPGQDKSGHRESACIEFRPGEVTALLGPTGSGKSRFLSDIESLAVGDTPSRREILLNGQRPDSDLRFELQGRLVAQLTQNMNFVLDMGVLDFINAHAASRGADDPESTAAKVIEAANALAGERFGPETQLTQLSGGQSRALMIADAALLSWSPILLIDEIENAGVDKRRSLDLLLKSDKIVLIATHDPVLGLSADRRLVFRNGAVHAVRDRTAHEERVLSRLLAMEDEFSAVKARLRLGQDLQEV